jgi:hypothetical protein
VLAGLQVSRAEKRRAQFPRAYQRAVGKSRWSWIP